MKEIFLIVFIHFIIGFTNHCRGQINNPDSENKVLDIEFNKKNFKSRNIGFNKAWENVISGNTYFKNNQIEEALRHYKIAESYNNEYTPVKSIIGICYFLLKDFTKSSEILRNIANNNDSLCKTIQYYIGCTHQHAYEFEQALSIFSSLNKQSDFEELKNLKIDPYNRFIECQNAKKYCYEKRDVEIINLTQINTEDEEYFPVYDDIDLILYYCNTEKNKYSEAFGKETISYLKEDSSNGVFLEFSYYKNLNKCMNFMTADGYTILYTICNADDGYGSCDIYFSEYTDGLWSEPDNVGSPINSKDHETIANITNDRNTFYFLRYVKGKRKIFISTRDSLNPWSEPEELQLQVSSENDISYIYLHPDEKTLYFCSDGEHSVGGYDIFRTTISPDGKWSEPENMGMDINTPFNEISIWVSYDKSYGFITSDRIGGQGKKDIYKIIFKK